MTEKYFYGEAEQEVYTCDSLDEYVQEIVDNTHPADLPLKIIVQKMAPEEISDQNFEVLNDLLERLDEDFSNPDDSDGTKPTEAMRFAEELFIATMKREYKNYWLDCVGKIEVDLLKWCRENGYPECAEELQNKKAGAPV